MNTTTDRFAAVKELLAAWQQPSLQDAGLHPGAVAEWQALAGNRYSFQPPELASGMFVVRREKEGLVRWALLEANLGDADPPVFMPQTGSDWWGRRLPPSRPSSSRR